MRFAKRTIQLEDGATIALWETQGKGIPVVLLHGFPETHLSFSKLLQCLRKTFHSRYRLIVYDLRGHGESSKNGEASLNRFFADHLQIIQKLGLKRYHLVGHDWGGAIALHAARFTPESLLSVAVLNTNYGNLDLLGMWHLLLFNLLFIPEALFRFLPERFYEFAMKRAYRDHQALPKEADRSYRSMFKDRTTTTYWLKLYRTLGKILLTLKLPSLLRPSLTPLPAENPKAWRVPTVLIWGAEDSFNPLWVGREIEERLRKKTKVDFHAIAKAKHFVQVEKPEEVARILESHWKENSPRRGLSREASPGTLRFSQK